MKIKTVLASAVVVVVFGAAPALASAPSGGTSRTGTPDSCIALNQGDGNACNVGNTGRGDLPYRSLPDTPNACVERNQGDWTACNVGNHPPYLPSR
jgi:hypothetical protein